MDGNDLNPVINSKGPTMHGPDPRPMSAMMPQVVPPAEAGAGTPAGAPVNGAAAMSATAQAPAAGAAPVAAPVTAAPNAMTGSDAAITSDAKAEAPGETSKRVQKIIALVTIAVCTGFAVLALAIVVLTNIPRIATIENRLDAIATQNEIMKEQIATLNKRIGYDIDVTFFDELTPGTTYSVTLQPDTREVMITTLAGCSLIDISECQGKPETATALLSVTEYELAVAAYNKMDGSAVNYTKNMINWTNALLAITKGDETIADTDSHDWEIIKIYDANGDGAVSSREYGTYLLTQMIK